MARASESATRRGSGLQVLGTPEATLKAWADELNNNIRQRLKMDPSIKPEDGWGVYFNGETGLWEPEDRSWKTWTPTYSASGNMLFTSVTTHLAEYKYVNKNEVRLRIRAGGTTSSSPPASPGRQLRFTVPLPMHPDELNGGGGYADQGGNPKSCVWWSLANIDTIAIGLYDAANWNLTSGTEFRLTVTYRTKA